jgi:hypothetical protein
MRREGRMGVCAPERLLAAVLVNDLQLPQCCIVLFGVHSERLLAAVLVNDLRREPERIHNGGMEWDMRRVSSASRASLACCAW